MNPNHDARNTFSLTAEKIIRWVFVLALFAACTALAGEKSFTETRQVSLQKLNEDPGEFDVDDDNHPPTPNPHPHPDEVFAAVHLIISDARSRAETLII